MTKETSNGMNKNRRNFLKILLFGGGALVVGGFFGPWISGLFSSKPKVAKDFENFNVTEDKKGLTISDKTGEEIFIIDEGK